MNQPQPTSTEDLARVQHFSQCSILVPCDKDSLPLSPDSDKDTVFWLAFESEELLRQSSAVEYDDFNWGQMQGLKLFHFIHERVLAGAEHIFVVNPGTLKQFIMDGESISHFVG